MKRLRWTDDGAFSIRLRDDLFTVCQMREKAFMQFFDIRSRDDNWKGIDLNQVDSLFSVLVANSTRDLYERRLASGTYTPSNEPLPRLMLKWVGARILHDRSPHRDRFDLVELGNDYEPYGAPILKKDLAVTDDLDLLHRHESAGMQVNPDALRERLTRYFDTGINFDDYKLTKYPDLPLPPPRHDPAGIPWYP